jgi:hypothetical protein
MHDVFYVYRDVPLGYVAHVFTALLTCVELNLGIYNRKGVRSRAERALLEPSAGPGIAHAEVEAEGPPHVLLLHVDRVGQIEPENVKRKVRLTFSCCM